MSKLQEFMDEWFPKTEEWDNVAKFILESGVELTDEVNPKWLTGYTNIGTSHKPHHKDVYTRKMEEGLFQLHDCVHNIFTLDTKCSEDEYVQRQLFGELFTFYLTEYEIVKHLKSHDRYFVERGCYNLMELILHYKPTDRNVIDYMWDCFIDDSPPMDFECCTMYSVVEQDFKKYSKMFKEDLENSRKNYKFVPKVKSYCIVGTSSQNHINFFEAVKKGVVKNIKREFNIKLPTEWI